MDKFLCRESKQVNQDVVPTLMVKNDDKDDDDDEDGAFTLVEWRKTCFKLASLAKFFLNLQR